MQKSIKYQSSEQTGNILGYHKKPRQERDPKEIVENLIQIADSWKKIHPAAANSYVGAREERLLKLISK